jgi:hypothetical protein
MTFRCPQVKNVWLKKRSGVSLRATRYAAVTSQPELLSRSEKAWDVAPEIIEVICRSVTGSDKI